MIDIKRLSPKILASAAFATFALGVGAVVATEMFVDSYRDNETFSKFDRVTTLEAELGRIALDGDQECKCLADRLAATQAKGELTALDGEDLVDCYIYNHDSDSAERTARLMSAAFPESADLLSIVGTFDLESGDYHAARINLNNALMLAAKHGIRRSNGAILNNNYAWVRLHDPNPDFNVLDYHTREASRLDSDNCNILHTRLTFEFARVINDGADQRDLENWVNVREPYVQCLMAFQSPRFREPGNYFALDSISEQVVSSYVMDGLLIQDLDVDASTAHYLAPARGTIEKYGPQRFCYDAMGVTDPYIQGACLRTIRQAKSYWDNGIR